MILRVGLTCLLLAGVTLARITMFQQQSCSYQPYKKELVCQCSEEQSSYLHLRIEYFVRNAGQEIRSVLVSSCIDILIGLDLLHLNPSTVPFTFKASRKVTIDFIKFDPKYTERQKLKLIFENVEVAKLSSLHVDEALQISVNNVKSFQLLKSTFNHIPALGLNVSKTSKLEIRDSIFLRVHPGSVMVESTKEVEVVNNEFSINAIKVISTRDGSHLFISCNRLLGHPVSPECLPTTTTTTTTSPETTQPTNMFGSTFNPMHSSSKEQRAVDGEIIAGLVSGVTVVFLVLLATIITLCVRDRQEVKRESEIVTEEVARSEVESKPYIPKPPTPPPMPNFDMETILASDQVTTDDNRMKFSAPVWLDEIQNNKIFTKQRNLLVEGSTTVDLEVLEDVVQRENSKTESDQESHTSV